MAYFLSLVTVHPHKSQLLLIVLVLVHDGFGQGFPQNNALLRDQMGKLLVAS
uniref:Uncharacterized protein n=1 Tax=Arundo donax TaxID=35708 RepID=A0A0A9FSE4_ARUDO